MKESLFSKDRTNEENGNVEKLNENNRSDEPELKIGFDIKMDNLCLTNTDEYEVEKTYIEDNSSICANKSGWHWMGGIVGDGDPDVAMENALNKLCSR